MTQPGAYVIQWRSKGGGGGGPPRAAHMGAAFLEKLKKQDEHK